MSHKPKSDEPTKSVSALALEILTSEADRTLEMKAGVLASENNESVHNLRVSIRRIRSGLRLFAEYLPPEISAHGDALHALFEELGKVRDLDIAVTEWTSALIPGPSSAEVLAALQQARGTARLRMTALVSKSRELEGFRAALKVAPNETPLALAVASDLISRTHHRVHLATTRLSSRSPAADVHSLRRRIKRLRYSVEFFADDFGKSAEEYIDHLKKLQNLLGEHQDNRSISGILRELPELSVPARESANLVVESIEVRDGRLREKIVREAHKFSDKSWRNLRSRMQKAKRDFK